jgi:glycerophosphoryl diester phosphodiesterase
VFVVSRTLDTVARNTFAGTALDLGLTSDQQPILRRSNANKFTANGLTTTKGTEVMYIFMVKNDDVPTVHLNENSQTHTATFAGGLLEGFDIIGENHHTRRDLSSSNQPIYALNGTMNEAILFTNDQTINLPALKENLNNQYELYS